MIGKLVPVTRVADQVGALSDEALLAACATGDPAALGALFDRFNVVVYRFVSRLKAPDDMLRDDLVQTTFLEIRKIAGRFHRRSSVKSWILGVAVNVVRQHRRSERRRRARQGEFVERLISVPETPDHHFDRRRRFHRISSAVAALPHDQQTAFLLCDVEQLPGTEVASVLEIPEGTLWRRLHSARKAIRDAVGRIER